MVRELMFLALVAGVPVVAQGQPEPAAGATEEDPSIEQVPRGIDFSIGWDGLPWWPKYHSFRASLASDLPIDSLAGELLLVYASQNESSSSWRRFTLALVPSAKYERSLTDDGRYVAAGFMGVGGGIYADNLGGPWGLRPAIAIEAGTELQIRFSSLPRVWLSVRPLAMRTRKIYSDLPDTEFYMGLSVWFS